MTQQNPEISAQFTLWGQYDSAVEMGRMIILPMGNTVLYVQPIYIASTKNKMPDLTRGHCFYWQRNDYGCHLMVGL